MATDEEGNNTTTQVVTIYNSTALSDAATSANNKHPFSYKVGLAQMLRGGAILEVTDPHQAKIAQSAGACAVVVSPPQQRAGVLRRMPDPSAVREIKRTVSIPVMAKARIGHFVEAQILEAIGVDYVDESEDLAVVDADNFINKHNFRCSFVSGCSDLGEALRRVREGAAMIRTRGSDVAGMVRSVRAVMGAIRALTSMDDDEVFAFAKRIGAPYDLVAQTKQMGRLPVVHFAAVSAVGVAGDISPADAAMMFQLGCDGVFVGSEIFDCSDPGKRIEAIVRAVRHYNDPQILADAMEGLGLSLGDDRVQ